jgi:OmpR family response regulator RpaB
LKRAKSIKILYYVKQNKTGVKRFIVINLIQKKILIIEDQLNIRRILSKKLKTLGYQVLTISNGREALKLLNFFLPDLIILDIMLPGVNGYEICKQIRKNFLTPIIFLTALNTVGDQVKAFEFGADDYIVKPFSLEEIERRILLILEKKNQKNEESEEMRINDLIVNFKKKIICKKDKTFNLNEIEIQIVKLLLSKKNKIFSRKEILNYVWGSNYFNHSDYRIVDFYISKLRSKIEDEPKNPYYIQTLRGVGYKFFQKNFNT